MSDLFRNLADFCRLLREGGVSLGPGDSADALRALALLDLRHRETVYLGLRTVLVKKVHDYPVFEATFRIFFDARGAAKPEQERHRPAGTGQGREAEGGMTGGYSATEAILRRDLASLGPDEQAEAAQAARLLARRLLLRLSRRHRLARHGHQLSMRATVRRSARRAGVVMELVKTRRRRKPANLVLLLDVSGSMELYSRVLFQFVHALQQGRQRTQSFCFATQLARVSNELQGAGGYGGSVERARRKVGGWGGGTRIGHALTELWERWRPALLRRNTTVIILSDGLDTESPERVETAIARIRSAVGRIIWLNPLAGDTRYQPLARAMVAALPYLDSLAPCHSLASLQALAHQLPEQPTIRREGWHATPGADRRDT